MQRFETAYTVPQGPRITLWRRLAIPAGN